MAELKGRHPKDCICPSHTIEGQKEHQRAYDEWRNQQPERMAYEASPERKKQQRETRKRNRLQALLTIAQVRGDDFPRCRIDLTPGTPVSDLPHRGKLTIDHIYGGGTREAIETHETSDRLVNSINEGRADPTHFRVLCQLHQLWNQIDYTDELFRRPRRGAPHASPEVHVRNHRRRA